jgi:hypothetical protein
MAAGTPMFDKTSAYTLRHPDKKADLADDMSPPPTPGTTLACHAAL